MTTYSLIPRTTLARVVLDLYGIPHIITEKRIKYVLFILDQPAPQCMVSSQLGSDFFLFSVFFLSTLKSHLHPVAIIVLSDVDF